MQGCLACAMGAGAAGDAEREVFAGRHWRVAHAPGAVPLGTLALVTRRHCLSVADLTAEEAVELGPLLRVTSASVMELTEGDEAHVEVWAYAEYVPGHLHFVVRPATAGTPHGAGAAPESSAREAFVARARAYFSARAAQLSERG